MNTKRNINTELGEALSEYYADDQPYAPQRLAQRVLALLASNGETASDLSGRAFYLVLGAYTEEQYAVRSPSPPPMLVRLPVGGSRLGLWMDLISLAVRVERLSQEGGE